MQKSYADRKEQEDACNNIGGRNGKTVKGIDEQQYKVHDPGEWDNSY